MKTFTISLLVGIIWFQSASSEYLRDYQQPQQGNSTDSKHLQVDHSPLKEIIPFEDVVIKSWSPWKKPENLNVRQEENEEECQHPSPSSINQFPEDLFTQEQRLQGAVILHFIGAAYFFTVSGLVINYYFIPSVQCICHDLNITPDVGAAVFMASATAMPELSTNLISTFIADSDMGLGAVIGSLMWNILGVASVSSLATRQASKATV